MPMNYIMEKVEFKGDNPSARFGHTITPIGKDRAILFGGAVGDTGKSLSIQESTSSLVTPISVITIYFVGRRWKTLGRHQPIELRITLFQSITFSMSSVGH